MRVTVVGSGDAFNAEGRFHSCYLLEDEDAEATMVDFGATALVALHRLGRRACDIDTFTFTHLHGDHLGGVPFLLIDGMFADQRSKPLRMVGPVGLEARVRSLVEFTYGSDMFERKQAVPIEFQEILPGQSTLAGNFQLEAFAADHQDPPEAPLCLRFTSSRGSTVAFSGDTQMCEGLLSAAENVDLLVAECSGLAPPAGRHCTWEDWSSVLPTLTAKRVLLTHLGAEVRRAVPRLLASAPAHPRLDFADDGLVVELLPQRDGPA